MEIFKAPSDGFFDQQCNTYRTQKDHCHTLNKGYSNQTNDQSISMDKDIVGDAINCIQMRGKVIYD